MTEHESGANATTAEQADYANLTPDCMIDAVESLGLYSDGRFIALNSYENRVYQVGLEGETPIIAKFYRPNRWSDEQILEEHTFSYELVAEDIPVVVPTVYDGKSLHSFAGYRFSLFERRGGRAADMDDFDNLLQLGRFLGRIHVVGSVKLYEHRPTIDISSYGTKSAELILKDFIPDSLRESYQSLTDDLLKLIKQRFSEVESVRTIRTHGDCHSGNLLWREGLPNFVDFDDSRMAPAVQDLWMLLSGSREEQELQLSEVIEEYDQFSSFDNKELSLIEPLRTLRIMHYAAWLARRWTDPAFPMAFPWFNTERYWGEHILELREQLSVLQEEPLRLL